MYILIMDFCNLNVCVCDSQSCASQVCIFYDIVQAIAVWSMINVTLWSYWLYSCKCLFSWPVLLSKIQPWRFIFCYFVRTLLTKSKILHCTNYVFSLSAIWLFIIYMFLVSFCFQITAFFCNNLVSVVSAHIRRWHHWNKKRESQSTLMYRQLESWLAFRIH